jgi:hypothetical protein
MQLSLFKSLRTMNRDVDILHSYDINCQFAVNMWERYETLPDNIKDVPPPSKDRWTHVIPKVHIKGHCLKCQERYSLNFHCGCGRTCGEGIERMWSLTNGIALSTREMRAGRRCDWIDFHMGHHNYMKQYGIGVCFLSGRRVLPTYNASSRRQACPRTDGGRSHGTRAFHGVRDDGQGGDRARRKCPCRVGERVRRVGWRRPLWPVSFPDIGVEDAYVWFLTMIHKH